MAFCKHGHVDYCALCLAENKTDYRPGAEALLEAQMEGRPLLEVAATPAPSAQQPAQLGAGANARQHGGDHYRNREYQHWDFVVDTRLHYLLGCATKYVSRWRKKNGVEDLEKAAHYLEKATECDIFPPQGIKDQLNRFVEQLEPNDRAIVVAICQGNYEAATMSIRWLMDNDAA